MRVSSWGLVVAVMLVGSACGDDDVPPASVDAGVDARAGDASVPVDECAMATADCDTDPLAVCADTASSFTCTCPSGYAGPGRGVDGCLYDDASLVSLMPLLGLLSPAFDSATTMYTLELPPGILGVTLKPAVAQPALASIQVDGAVVLSGESSAEITLSGLAPTAVSIVVTAASRRTRTYTVVITRSATYAKASNTGADDHLGSSIALSTDGSTLAVGADGEASSATGIGGNQADDSAFNAGAVYVFTRVGGVWTQQAYVKASNTNAGDLFGHSVALSADGSTLAVGANGEASVAVGVGGDDADNGAPRAGAAYVFTRAAGAWSQQAYVKASNTNADDLFGESVALSSDGSTLAVSGAFEASSATGIDGNQADNSAVRAGAVYVFARTGTAWSQQAYVKASNTNAGDLFGYPVVFSADGSTLAVGAAYEDSSATGVDGNQASEAASASGAVYVFTRAGVTWSQQAYVKASNTNADDFFGQAVALSADGSTLAIGARGEASSATGIGGDEANDSAMEAGAVYVFTRAGLVWSQQAYLKASNTDAGDGFGSALALAADGSTLLVGAPFEASRATGIDGDQADDTTMQSGAAYLFTRAGATWSQVVYVKASNTDAGDLFGQCVALSGSGTVLAITARGEASRATGIDGDASDDSASASGAAYVY